MVAFFGIVTHTVEFPLSEKRTSLVVLVSFNLFSVKLNFALLKSMMNDCWESDDADFCSKMKERITNKMTSANAK
jgi:hypothetical protein